MSFVEELRRDPDRRSRLFSTLWLVGLVATLPIPRTGAPFAWNGPLTALWFASGALAWAAYYRPAWIAGLWIAAFFVASVLFWKFTLLLPLVLLVLWAAWNGFRSKRLEDSAPKKTLALSLFLAAAAGAQVPPTPAPEQTFPLPGAEPPAADPNASTLAPPDDVPPDIVVPVDPNAKKKAEEEKKKKERDEMLYPVKDIKLNRQQEKRRQDAIQDFKKTREEVKRSLPKPGETKGAVGPDPAAPPPEAKVMIPKYMSGYGLRDLTSCSVLDRIPWKFRPDQRKTRLLMKDYLRYQNQTRFYNWEIYQTMDKDGYISYIVRRPISGGRYESLVVKDTAYNRIIDDPVKGQRVIESQDLKTLINREALIFYHVDGSTVSYLPSSIGNSVLTLQLTSTTGRQQAPVFLRGSICDRPADTSDEDSEAKKIMNDRNKGAPGTPPAIK